MTNDYMLKKIIKFQIKINFLSKNFGETVWILIFFNEKCKFNFDLSCLFNYFISMYLIKIKNALFQPYRVF